jgi:hypothetical protein
MAKHWVTGCTVSGVSWQHTGKPNVENDINPARFITIGSSLMMLAFHGIAAM